MTGNQLVPGVFLVIAAACCGISAGLSYKKDPRRYSNVVLLDAALILMLGGLSILTRQEELLFMLWRLAAFFVVPSTSAAVGVLLLLDGVFMLRHEGLGRSTLLPFFSGTLLLGTMTLTVLSYLQYIHPPIELRPLMAYSVLASFFVAVTFLTMVGYGVVACREPKIVRCDYIIVHGCGIFGERITPLLRGRVDKAVELYRRCGGKGKIVVSGGMGPGESISEAEAMRRYLESIRIPMEDVILEDRSTTTRENLRFVRDLLETNGEQPRYLCVTSDYHAFRTSIYARKLGMDAVCVGSRTALYFRPSAAIREYIALMYDAKWLNLGLLVLWAMLTWKDFISLDQYRAGR